jgi:hypothetical protein
MYVPQILFHQISQLKLYAHFSYPLSKYSDHTFDSYTEASTNSGCVNDLGGKNTGENSVSPIDIYSNSNCFYGSTSSKTCKVTWHSLLDTTVENLSSDN